MSGLSPATIQRASPSLLLGWPSGNGVRLTGTPLVTSSPGWLYRPRFRIKVCRGFGMSATTITRVSILSARCIASRLLSRSARAFLKSASSALQASSTVLRCAAVHLASATSNALFNSSFLVALPAPSAAPDFSPAIEVIHWPRFSAAPFHKSSARVSLLLKVILASSSFANSFPCGISSRGAVCGSPPPPVTGVWLKNPKKR